MKKMKKEKKKIEERKKERKTNAFRDSKLMLIITLCKWPKCPSALIAVVWYICFASFLS